MAPRWVRLAAFRPVIIGSLHRRGLSVLKAIFPGPHSLTNEEEPDVRAKWSTGGREPVALNANTQWLASARAKLGFTGWFNNTMLYITGGGAWANIEYNATFVTTPGASQSGRAFTDDYQERMGDRWRCGVDGHP